MCTGKRGELEVAAVVPSSSADASGLVRPGDVLVAIDATLVHDMTLTDARQALLGPPVCPFFLGLLF